MSKYANATPLLQTEMDLATNNATTSSPIEKVPSQPPQQQTILNGDFEEGPMNWSPEGEAFRNWPTPAASLTRTAGQVNPNLVPIGGDYWQNSPYPPYAQIQGYSGNHLVVSDSNLQGRLISEDFLIPNGATGISFRLGALGNIEAMRDVYVDFEFPSTKLLEVPYETFGRIHPTNNNGLLEPRRMRLNAGQGGQAARISIVDNSTTGGQILADRFIFVYSSQYQPQPGEEDVAPYEILMPSKEHVPLPQPVEESATLPLSTENLTQQREMVESGLGMSKLK